MQKARLAGATVGPFSYAMGLPMHGPGPIPAQIWTKCPETGETLKWKLVTCCRDHARFQCLEAIVEIEAAMEQHREEMKVSREQFVHDAMNQLFDAIERGERPEGTEVVYEADDLPEANHPRPEMRQ